MFSYQNGPDRTPSQRIGLLLQHVEGYHTLQHVIWKSAHGVFSCIYGGLARNILGTKVGRIFLGKFIPFWNAKWVTNCILGGSTSLSVAWPSFHLTSTTMYKMKQFSHYSSTLTYDMLPNITLCLSHCTRKRICLVQTSFPATQIASAIQHKLTNTAEIMYLSTVLDSLNMRGVHCMAFGIMRA